MLRGLCPTWQQCPILWVLPSLTKEEMTISARIELLLADIRDAFAKEGEAPVANMFAEKVDVEIVSADLVKALVAIEGRSWAEMGKSGKPLTQNKLARMLKPLDIRPGKVGPKNARLNGYKLSQFKDAFDRYLGSEGVSQPDNRTERDEIRTSDISKVDTQDNGCPVAKCEKPNNDGPVSGCPVAKGDDILDIPRFLDPRPRAADDPADYFPASLRRCAHCNRNGALGQIALPDRPGTIWLHRECEGAWLEATTDKQTS